MHIRPDGDTRLYIRDQMQSVFVQCILSPGMHLQVPSKDSLYCVYMIAWIVLDICKYKTFI